MKQWYYGLADCHGVESFVFDLDDMSAEMFTDEGEKKTKNSQQFAMCLRAQANQQRHAVVYRAELEDQYADQIEALIKEGKYTDALTMIKENAHEVQVGTYGTTKKAAEKNWKMIPNPDLDPYHN
jgi:hypothetical protein